MVSRLRLLGGAQPPRPNTDFPLADYHGVKIIIHRGTKQIGGSCLEVATVSTRLILDVSLPLDDLAAPAAISPLERGDEMASTVFARSPEVAAAIHTTRPGEFRRYFPNALLLNDGEPREIC